MELMPLKEYEVTFRKWDLERRVLTCVFWILTSLYILIFILYPLLYPHLAPLITYLFPQSTVLPESPALVFGIPPHLWTPIIVGLGLVYFIIIVIIRLCLIPRNLSKLSKGSCIFSAIVAAEDLENGNPVRASLFMDKLLSAISYFLRQKLDAVRASYATPREFMQVKPEAIPRRAVFRAIQTSEDTKEFQERLKNLAIGLHGVKSEGYLIAYRFLTWLDKRVEPYSEGSQNYLEKFPVLKTTLQEVAPVILPFIGAIVVAIL